MKSTIDDRINSKRRLFEMVRSVIFEFVGEAERIDIIEGLVHAANTRYSLVFTQLNLTKI